MGGAEAPFLIMRREDFALVRNYIPTDIPSWEALSLPLVLGVDALTDRLGVRALWISTYRTEAHNASVGGASDSRHKTGEASDLFFKGVPLDKQYAEARNIPQFGGVGLYYPEQTLHVDVRPRKADGRLYEWGRLGGRGNPYVAIQAVLAKIPGGGATVVGLALLALSVGLILSRKG